MKKIVVTILSLCSILICNLSFCADYSSDPNDFSPIIETVWKVNYTQNSINISKTIYFNKTIVNNDNNEIGMLTLNAADEEQLGFTMYGDIPKFPSMLKKGFSCSLLTASGFNQFYFFNLIETNTLVGKFVYYTKSDMSDIKITDLTGYKILDLNQVQTESHAEPIADSSGEGNNGCGCFISSINNNQLIFYHLILPSALIKVNARS